VALLSSIDFPEAYLQRGAISDSTINL